jgi:hypothetical protein
MYRRENRKDQKIRVVRRKWGMRNIYYAVVSISSTSHAADVADVAAFLPSEVEALPSFRFFEVFEDVVFGGTLFVFASSSI